MEAADREPRPTVYTPWLQKTWPWLSWQTSLLRLPAGADPSETAVSVRRALTELDPDLAIHRLVALSPGARLSQLFRRNAHADEAGDDAVVDLAHDLDDVVTREGSASHQMPQ